MSKRYMLIIAFSLLCGSCHALTLASKCMADIAKLHEKCIAYYTQTQVKRVNDKSHSESIKNKCEDLAIRHSMRCVNNISKYNLGLNGCDVKVPPIDDTSPVMKENLHALQCWHDYYEANQACKKKIRSYQSTRNYKWEKRTQLLAECRKAPLQELQRCAQSVIDKPIAHPPLSRSIYDLKSPWFSTEPLVKGAPIYVCWERIHGDPKWYKATYLRAKGKKKACVKLNRKRTTLCTWKAHMINRVGIKLRYPTKESIEKLTTREKILFVLDENHALLKALADKVKKGVDKKTLNNIKLLNHTFTDSRHAIKKYQLRFGDLILTFKTAYLGKHLMILLTPIEKYKGDEVFYNCTPLTKDFPKAWLPDICRFKANYFHYHFVD